MSAGTRKSPSVPNPILTFFGLLPLGLLISLSSCAGYLLPA